jgi:mRNA interferase MazF
MVKQGDIIKMNFDPQSGREQAGYRPAVVVSNDSFNARTGMAIVCPITNTYRRFPLHIPLDERTQTTGYVLCDHIKSVDLAARGFTITEQIPEDLLDNILAVIFSEMDKPENLL